MTRRAEVIDTVWAGHPVGFGAVADEQTLYVGYYDAQRYLTIASRPIAGGTWHYRRFRSRVGWDSHKYITLALDRTGRVHVAANMHVSPLNYYRMVVPGDIDSIEKVPVMADPALETAVTYPAFMLPPEGRLIFSFRDGTCSDGNTIHYSFDEATMRWETLTNAPLLDGRRQRNAYPVGPVPDVRGQFHLTWVWRDTIYAESNHSLSHAQSRDLIHWQSADGTPLDLPITLETSPLVDPVEQGGGMINNNTLIGFDSDDRPLISYHKYDASGDTQIYLARFEHNRWHSVQASDWTGYRWDFSGPGTLTFEILLEPAGQEDDRIVVPVSRLGRRSRLLLDAASLSRIGEVPRTPSAAEQIASAMDCPDGMEIQSIGVEAGGRLYLLAWATLPTNRDLPRSSHPQPSELRLIEIK